MKHKFEKAEQVTSVAMFEELVPEHTYWKWRDRTVLTGVLLNFTYRRLKVSIDRGDIWTVRPVAAIDK